MEYGMEVAKKFNWIFAVWDGRRDALFLCRDRLGDQAAVLRGGGSTLVFGSEPKALFAHPQIYPRVDLDSFREIFGVRMTRTPSCGVFRRLRKVNPGCILECSREGVTECANEIFGGYHWFYREDLLHADGFPMEMFQGACPLYSDVRIDMRILKKTCTHSEVKV